MRCNWPRRGAFPRTSRTTRALSLALAGSVLALLGPQGAWAQDPTLPGSEVRVEKLFDARLDDARRLGLTPSLPALDTARVTQRYGVMPVESDIAYDPPRIRPLAIKTEAPPDPYKGFARLGAGLPAAFIGDLGYATRNDRLALRSDLHGYGIRGGYDGQQRYGEFDGRLGATYYTDAALAVDLDLRYDRRGYRYYGFEEARRDTSDRLPAQLQRQHFGVFGIDAGVRNVAETPSGISYYARLRADFLEDNFATAERHTQLAGGGRRDFGEAWYAEIALDLDFVNFDGRTRQDLKVYRLRPTVGAHFDQLGLRLGATIANENDVFAYYPAVEVSYAINPSFVVVAGADGGPRQHSYHNLTTYLPYLSPDSEIRIAQERRLFGSVQGRTRGIDFAATASFTRVNGLALFVEDSAAAYRFMPRYDSAGIFGLRLDASAPIGARLTGGLQVENRVFSLETADEPYLLPSFDAQLRARYVVVPDRFNVTGFVIAQNSLPVWRPSDRAETPETGFLLDLSVHGEYEFGGRFSAFAQANNLFNNQRRKFPYYPIIGINVLAGLTARF